MAGPTASQPAAVVLHTRTGCQLCDEARGVVAAVCERAGQPWSEVDIDTAGDPAVLARWTDHVPVVTVGGRVVDVLRVDPERLSRALRHRD